MPSEHSLAWGCNAVLEKVIEAVEDAAISIDGVVPSSALVLRSSFAACATVAGVWSLLCPKLGVHTVRYFLDILIL